jgi:hypothetical protein
VSTGQQTHSIARSNRSQPRTRTPAQTMRSGVVLAAQGLFKENWPGSRVTLLVFARRAQLHRSGRSGISLKTSLVADPCRVTNYQVTLLQPTRESRLVPCFKLAPQRSMVSSCSANFSAVCTCTSLPLTLTIKLAILLSTRRIRIGEGSHY